MSRADWWRGAVIYQIYPRSFYDSDGDGVGDLPGVIAKLDHVASLGADAIWLAPFFVSPQRDFGYDVADHTAVDPLFGTLDDFDRLLERAHALGLKVLIDQVWSHTSDRHAWFVESRACRQNSRADWYVWANPSADGVPPNNWLSVFGGAAWTWEPRRRQYYLHHFLTHQPALNLHNPNVLDALLATGEFWLRRGVDGFRLDAIDFFLHDTELRSNPPVASCGDAPIKPFGMQDHVHDMLHPGTSAITERIRSLLDRYPGTAALGEVSSQPGALGRVMSYTAENARLHMAYTLRPLRGGFDWATVRQMVTESGDCDAPGWACWAFSNHDVERAVSRWHPRKGEVESDPDFARLLMALLLSLRGSVSLYQGEELGLPEANLAPHELRDPFGIAYWPEFRGRDGSRTPMPWRSGLAHAGFTTAQTSWLPVPSSHHALAVDAHEADEEALLHSFRRFLFWRRGQPALVRGALHPLALPRPLIGFVREHEGQRVIAAFNLSESPAVLDLSGFGPVRPQPESGFAVEIENHAAILPGFGAFFAAAAGAVAIWEASPLAVA